MAMQCSNPTAITSAMICGCHGLLCRSELHQPASGGIRRSCHRGQCPGVALARARHALAACSGRHQVICLCAFPAPVQNFLHIQSWHPHRDCSWEWEGSVFAAACSRVWTEYALALLQVHHPAHAARLHSGAHLHVQPVVACAAVRLLHALCGLPGGRSEACLLLHGERCEFLTLFLFSLKPALVAGCPGHCRKQVTILRVADHPFLATLDDVSRASQTSWIKCTAKCCMTARLQYLVANGVSSVP